MLDAGGGIQRNIVLLAAVLALALLLRIWGLGHPAELVFDEQYYALDAYGYLGGTPELGAPDDPVKIPNEAQWEHPPLAKIMIALGEGPLGFTPTGWRLPAALTGVAGVAVVFLLGLALFDRTSIAAAAALLTAVEGLHIVQSRLAMLDIFSTTLATAALLGAVLYRRTGSLRSLAWTGVALGASIACKWSAVLVAPLTVLVALMGFRAWAPRTSLRRLILCLGALPVGVYLLSYGQFWLAHGPAVVDFVTLQGRMFDRLHHGTGVGSSGAPAFASRPGGWPLLLDPINYFEAGKRQIVGLGNPAVWWAMLLSLPFGIVLAASRRGTALRLVLAGALLAWAPWLVLGRPMYSYYLVAAVPYVALWLAGVCGLAPGAWMRRAGFGWACGAAVVGLVLFLHLWIAAPFPPWHSDLRWLPSWPIS